MNTVEQYPRSGSEYRGSPQPTLVRVAGNCQASDAHVICLGELHYFRYQDLVGKYIRNSATPLDVVLVEGYPADFVGSPITAGLFIYAIPQGVTAKGWEDWPLYKRATAIMDRWDEVSKILKTPRDLSIDSITSYVKEFEILDAQVDSVVIAERNKALANAIALEQRTIANGSKIFAIAGWEHFMKDPVLCEFLSKLKFVVYKTEPPDYFA